MKITIDTIENLIVNVSSEHGMKGTVDLKTGRTTINVVGTARNNTSEARQLAAELIAVCNEIEAQVMKGMKS